MAPPDRTPLYPAGRHPCSSNVGSSGSRGPGARARGSRPPPSSAAGSGPRARARRPASTARRTARGHRRGVERPVDARGAQHPVAAELHRERGVRRRADPRVEQDGDLEGLGDHGDGVGVADPEARADRRAERHDRRAARLRRAAGTRRGRPARRPRRRTPRSTSVAAARTVSIASGRSVRSSPITSSLTHVVSNASRASRASRDGLCGGPTARGVRQYADRQLLRAASTPSRPSRVDAAQRDGRDLGPRGDERLAEQVQRGHRAGARARGGSAARRRRRRGGPAPAPSVPSGTRGGRGSVGSIAGGPRASCSRSPGSDSSGGAGLQADLRDVRARSGSTVRSRSRAVTAQNTIEVTAVLAVEPEMVRAQVRGGDVGPRRRGREDRDARATRHRPRGRAARRTRAASPTSSSTPSWSRRRGTCSWRTAASTPTATRCSPTPRSSPRTSARPPSSSACDVDELAGRSTAMADAAARSRDGARPAWS